MNIDTTIKSKGEFFLITHTGHTYDANGVPNGYKEIIGRTFPNQNKITLTGFERFLQSQGGGFTLLLGTGNTAPAETDTTLAAYAGKSNNVTAYSTVKNATPDVDGYVTWTMEKRVTFAPGSLGGGAISLAEAAVVTNVDFSIINGSTAVNARGLLVDSFGAPTTLSTDNAIEYVDAIWRYTEYVKASVTSTEVITIDGVDTNFDVEVRPYYFDFPGASVTGNFGWGPSGANEAFGLGLKLGGGSDDNASATCAFSSGVTTITGNALGGSDSDRVPIGSLDTYVALSKQRVIKLKWLGAKCNLSGGIGCIRVTLGHTCWQVGYTPKIPKVDPKQLDITFTISMSNK